LQTNGFGSILTVERLSYRYGDDESGCATAMVMMKAVNVPLAMMTMMMKAVELPLC